MNINVLIVDDDKTKHRMIRDVLVLEGILDDSINYAESAVEARKELNKKIFDLLLLDINIPSRNEPSYRPSAENGMELLRQIVEDDEFLTPKNIVGITSDLNSFNEYDRKFRALTTQILHIDPMIFEWKSSLKYLINRIRSSSTNSYATDVCILTALREPELSEVLKIPLMWGSEESLGNGILIRKGKIKTAGGEKTLVVAHCNQMGMVASSFTSALLLGYFKPQLFLMTGICGGISDKASLGDLIVGEKSWDWQSGKWLDGGAFEMSPDTKESTPELVALVRGMGGEVERFHYEFRGNRPGDIPKIHVGPMISGSAVVADPQMHLRFLAQHRKAIGVDMECFGVYFSASMIPDPAPKFLCIKSVSDLADRQKSDNFQEYCSYLSAQVAIELVRKFFK